MKRYWLIKSEPDVFSIDDLSKKKDKTTFWDGVRNYQARNYLRDEIKSGDGILFYHSNCEPNNIVGICEVVKEGYPDHTQFDPSSSHYFPKSDPKNPTWFMVDIKFTKKFSHSITLDEIRQNPKLKDMKVIQRGNRLSVMPVTKEEWDEIVKMGK